MQGNKSHRGAIRDCLSRIATTTALIPMFVLLSFLLSVPLSNAGALLPLQPVTAPETNPQTPEKIDLGRKLFFDRRLSGDGTMSCATCHIPEMAFSDGQDISLSYPTTKNWRNSPTLINVAFNKFLFYDGRARTLEEQALFPMMSAFEMNKNLDYLEEQIAQVPEYVDSFRKIFNGEVTRERIAMAIASFERTLVSTDSPLDKFLRGDQKALSDDARKGLEVFQGKGKCADCHYGVNLSDDKFHALHVPENPALQNDPGVIATVRFVAKIYHFPEYRNLREDPGRYLVTMNMKDWKAFRTSTLREISKTGPYMHNGVFSSLEEVVDFFNKGGGKGNAALKPLGLSDGEKKALEKFLTEALEGNESKVPDSKVP